MLPSAGCEKGQDPSELEVMTSPAHAVAHAEAKDSQKAKFDLRTPEKALEKLFELYAEGRHIDRNILTVDLYDDFINEQKIRPNAKQVPVDSYRIERVEYPNHAEAIVTITMRSNERARTKKMVLSKELDQWKVKSW